MTSAFFGGSFKTVGTGVTRTSIARKVARVRKDERGKKG